MVDPPTNIILDMQHSGLSDVEIIRRLREHGYAEQDINSAFNQAKVKSAIQTEELATEPAEPVIPEETEDPLTTSTTAAAMIPSEELDFAGEEEAMHPLTTPAPAPTPSGQGAAYYEGYGGDVAQQPAQAEGYESYGAEGYGGAYTAEAFEEIAESIIEERWQAFTDKVGDISNWKDRTDREIERIYSRIDKIDEAITSIHAALLEKVTQYGRSIKGLGTDVKAVEKALSQILEPLMHNIKELKGITEKLKEKKSKKH